MKPAPGTVRHGEIAPGWAACVPAQARIRIWHAGKSLASTYETPQSSSTRLEARPGPAWTRRARPQHGGEAQRESFCHEPVRPGVRGDRSCAGRERICGPVPMASVVGVHGTHAAAPRLIQSKRVCVVCTSGRRDDYGV